MRIAVDQAALTFAAHPGYSQYTGQEGADGTADAMHAEDVETVVIAERVLEPGGTPIADDAGSDADDQCATRIDKTRRRSDRDQPGDRARDDAEHARLAFDDPLGEHPGKSSSRGRNLGHRHRHAGIAVGRRR